MDSALGANGFGETHSFSPGDVVEYHSVSSGGWIRAKVTGLEPGGNYSLDVKTGVPPSKIRPPPGVGVDIDATMSVGSSQQLQGYAVGEAVEYYSASNGGWVATKVLSKSARGTYDLECRHGVTPDKIRRPGVQGSQARLGQVPQSQDGLPRVPGTVLPGSCLSMKAPSQASSCLPSKGSTAPPPSDRLSAAPQYSLPTPKSSQPSLQPSHAAPKNSVPSTLEQPIQLLSVQRRETKWIYEVNPEGARALQSYGSRRISVVAICGLYRTGKSYILNLLLERVQRGLPLFQVGSTTRACTEGLWLWGSVDSTDSSSPLLAFIDCEGFGSTDSDRTRDAQLMTLCALLASVLVLNTKGALSESIFNALSLVCRFAEHVEERGNQASRPILLWLLRDFQLDLLDPEGNPISPADYLERALHAAPLSGHDAERGQAAKEVRQSLLKFFSLRSCHTLVRPVIDESELQKLEQLPYDRLRPEFTNGVESLKLDLVAKSHQTPKAVGGQVLTCASFVALMQQLVKSMNESQILSVKGAWDTVQHSACGSLTDELRQQACSWLRSLTSGQRMEGGVQLPLADMALNELLEGQRQRLRMLWDERSVGDEATRAEYWKELVESLSPEENVTRERNNRLADMQLGQAAEAWRKWLDESSGTWETGQEVIDILSKLMARTPQAALARAAAGLIEAAGKRIVNYRNSMAELGGRAREAVSGQMAELEAQLSEAKRAEQAVRLDLQARMAELSNIQAQRQQLLTEAEAVRARELETRRQVAMIEERRSSMQGDLEMAKAQAARVEGERANLERTMRSTRAEFEASELERRRLEAQVQQMREEYQNGSQKFRAEREALHNEKAQLMQQLNDERRGQAALREGQGQARSEIDRFAQELREARNALAATQQELHMKDRKLHDKDVELQDAQLRCQRKEKECETAKVHHREQLAEIYREQAEKEKCLRADLEWVKEAASRSESKFLASERLARKARWEADTALEERKWYEQEAKKGSSHVPCKGQSFTPWQPQR